MPPKKPAPRTANRSATKSSDSSRSAKTSKVESSIPVKTITPPPLPSIKENKKCGVDGYCCQGKPPEECCGGNCDGNCGCKGESSSFKSCCAISSCHILALFTKRSTWICLFIASIGSWIFGLVWHAWLLIDRYHETAYLWRSEADMQALLHWMPVYHILYGVIFTLLFRLTQPQNYIQGAKNGFLIAAFPTVCLLMCYITQPIPTDILRMWATGDLLLGVMLGLLLTPFVSKRSRCCNDSYSSEGSSCGSSCGCK